MSEVADGDTVCAHEYGPTNPQCGVKICTKCGEHKGLDRCFCGWSRSGGDGHQQLVNMGEQIEDDY